MKLLAYIDGSSKGNPGEAGYGIVLIDEKGNKLETVSQYIGQATNNVAEYRALLGCLELTRKYRADHLVVYSDSELLVSQIRGIYRVKKPHLQRLYDMVKVFLEKGSINLEIYHVPREKNQEADKLARQASRRRNLEDSSVIPQRQNG